jgi:hypothetical protein
MHEEPRADGPYVITLCPLASPVSIRPPQSPVLKQFTFFVAPTRATAGSQLALHMGYFETLAQAEPWLQQVRGRYPNAIATTVPAQPAGPAAVPDLTDTQVMQNLESRGVHAPQSNTDAAVARIPLLRPEDTGERRMLREAVVSRAPVRFAVQLDWSLDPIDPTRMRRLSAFAGLHVYVASSHREGSDRYFLRVGFFDDPGAAKQMALSARATYRSAVIVPVTDVEIARAHDPVAQAAVRDSAAAVNRKSERPAERTDARPAETLEETLETLAEREKWDNLGSTEDSGVRHLRVEMEQRRPKRP